MNPVKRVGVGVLLVVGVALFASTPVEAKRAPKGDDWGTISLTNLDVEPDAFGEATLTGVYPDRKSGLPIWWGTLSVKCWNLTPGAWYSTPVGTLRPSRKVAGQWEVTGTVQLDAVPPSMDTITFSVEVIRIDPDLDWFKVLSGEFIHATPW
jgi:hypothetical protein